MDELKRVTFEEFSEMNRRRCESYSGFAESLQPDSKFTLGDWARMIASEAGEVCDATLGWEGKKERRAGKTLEDIAEELADLITLCDLAIQKTGQQTVDVLVRKFNAVNERNGFGTRFRLAPPSPSTAPTESPKPLSEAVLDIVCPVMACNAPVGRPCSPDTFGATTGGICMLRLRHAQARQDSPSTALPVSPRCGRCGQPTSPCHPGIGYAPGTEPTPDTPPSAATAHHSACSCEECWERDRVRTPPSTLKGGGKP